MDTSKTSILMVFHSIPQAKIIEGLLKSNGITCFLSNEDGVALNPFFIETQGSIKLHVAENEVDAARGILTGRWRNEEITDEQ